MGLDTVTFGKSCYSTLAALPFLFDVEVYRELESMDAANEARPERVVSTLKPGRKANGTFSILCSSNEPVKQFVQLYRQSSLCRRKKHCGTKLHSQVSALCATLNGFQPEKVMVEVLRTEYPVL